MLKTILFLLLVVTFSSCDKSQSITNVKDNTTGSVSGKVSYPDSTPIQGFNVMLYRDQKELSKTQTDFSGNYYFPEVSGSDNINIKFKKNDFLPYSANIFVGDKDITFDFISVKNKIPLKKLKWVDTFNEYHRHVLYVFIEYDFASSHFSLPDIPEIIRSIKMSRMYFDFNYPSSLQADELIQCAYKMYKIPDNIDWQNTETSSLINLARTNIIQYSNAYGSKDYATIKKYSFAVFDEKELYLTNFFKTKSPSNGIFIYFEFFPGNAVIHGSFRVREIDNFLILN